MLYRWWPFWFFNCIWLQCSITWSISKMWDVLGSYHSSLLYCRCCPVVTKWMHFYGEYLCRYMVSPTSHPTSNGQETVWASCCDLLKDSRCDRCDMRSIHTRASNIEHYSKNIMEYLRHTLLWIIGTSSNETNPTMQCSFKYNSSTNYIWNTCACKKILIKRAIPTWHPRLEAIRERNWYTTIEMDSTLSA